MNQHMAIKEFSPGVLERMGYYVYALIDKKTNKIFYVGKGLGNRIFQHALEAKDNDKEDASEKIKTIQKNGGDIGYLILRHWPKKWANDQDKKELDKKAAQEQQAFEVESMMIDFLSSDIVSTEALVMRDEIARIAHLDNIQSGHRQAEGGISTIDEIEEVYNIQDADIEKYLNEGLRFLAIKLHHRYSNDVDIYDHVRFSWKVNLAKANRQDYVLAVNNGIIRGVYPCKGCWRDVSDQPKDKGRRCFDQEHSKQDPDKTAAIKKDLVGKRLKGLSKAMNPLNYIHGK